MSPASSFTRRLQMACHVRPAQHAMMGLANRALIGAGCGSKRSISHLTSMKSSVLSSTNTSVTIRSQNLATQPHQHNPYKKGGPSPFPTQDPEHLRKARGNNNLWLIFGLGGGVVLYGLTIYLSKKKPEEKPKPTGTLGLEPVPEDTNVIFVLGGPGAGKGTQCANLVRDYGFVHLSAGDLLREERHRPGSPVGELINNIIKEGQIVPMEITISLLHAAMKKSGAKNFLIDGFPRALDQAEKFEEEVIPSKLVLYFECPEEELLKRLMKRGETSGRVDDNIESIKKRFAVFKSTSYPVIEEYQKRGKVAKISCLNTVDGVYKETKKAIDKQFK